jgi:hypothetical protein
MKERGPLLTVWLTLMLAANIVTLILYSMFAIIPIGHTLFLPNVHLIAIYIFVFLGAINLVCIGFLFLWRKWAFYILCANAGAILIVNLFEGVGALAFFGILGVVSFYLIVRPKWSLFH